jgi:hypothetical protein
MQASVVAIFFMVIYWAISFGNTHFDEHVRLAQAMTHGHLWVTDVPPWMEHFQFDGRTYFVQPPGPALLMIPFVWLRGTVSQSHASLLIGSIGVVIAWLMIKRDRLWLTAFFGFGTIYTWALANGDSWELASVASVPFSLLAIKETLESRNPLLVGLCAGTAALQRYDLTLAWPFYALLMRRRFYEFALGVLPAALILAWFNYERFGSLFTTDLSVYAAADPQAHGMGPFQLSYLPINLNVLLFMPPYLDARWPYLHPHFGGQALVWTSPAFLAAFRVTERSLRVFCLWAMAICASVPSLLVYASGYIQFGARYYIQVYPFLFALMVLHAEETGLDKLDKLLICVSIFFVLFGIWYIHVYSWGW